MTSADLPAVNAALNGLAAVLLMTGFVLIRRGHVAQHRACMISAFAVSSLFLISYVTYHALHGSTRFAHTGAIRWIYYTILISHVLLAAAIVPLAITTLLRGLRGQIEKHRRLARWTWPIWMYVSVTGVVIYLMLYQLFPGS